MLIDVWVIDNYDGTIHQVGTDTHDTLQMMNGECHYYNLQNGCGTLGGNYSFVERPELDNYISVTVDDLRVNKEKLHEEVLKMLEERNFFDDED